MQAQRTRGRISSLNLAPSLPIHLLVSFSNQLNPGCACQLLLPILRSPKRRSIAPHIDMAARSRPRGGQLKEEFDEERSIWNSIKADGRRVDQFMVRANFTTTSINISIFHIIASIVFSYLPHNAKTLGGRPQSLVSAQSIRRDTARAAKFGRLPKPRRARRKLYNSIEANYHRTVGSVAKDQGNG